MGGVERASRFTAASRTTARTSGRATGSLWLQSGFGSVHLVFFANAEQARYAYREMHFKRSTLLNHNLFIDWETDPGPSRAVRSMVVDCLRTA